MAVPKRKKSRSNTHHRRSQWKAQAAALVECPQCHDKKLPHIACATCGTYNRRQVVEAAS
ncbi:MAG: 50S ribosomal protein L32 [Streptosporangiaceae bacterium]